MFSSLQTIEKHKKLKHNYRVKITHVKLKERKIQTLTRIGGKIMYKYRLSHKKVYTCCVLYTYPEEGGSGAALHGAIFDFLLFCQIFSRALGEDIQYIYY